MYNDMEKDTFGFEPNNEQNSFDYNGISGLGESDYENEDLFNVEVDNTPTESSDAFEQPEKEELGYNVEVPFGYDVPNFYQYSDTLNNNFENPEIVQEDEVAEGNNNVVEVKEEPEQEFEPTFNTEFVSELPETEEDDSTGTGTSKIVDTEFLENSGNFENNSIENDYELPVVEPTVAPQVDLFSETPIEELNKLTEFDEEKVQTTDIKSLFDRVGVNVKEASDIFKKNTEMKEKIDSRFEELKKLQAEVEKSKKSQYDEINTYKEEVLGKLTEKKEEIEKRLNKLKEFQTSLEKEKEEFEKFRKAEREDIERVQKEVQEAYDSRREELNHIEDVLRRQKDALDEERSQLSLDRIQYESDKNELANNLLKFNEIVDSFTSGMDKINKE